MILRIGGVLFLAFGAFVGFLHGVLVMQGKYDPENLGRIHDWPVIGGFFPRSERELKPPTEEELRAERAALRLEQTKAEFKLPPPFRADELEKIVTELREEQTRAAMTRREQEEERDRLKRAEDELTEKRAEVMKDAADNAVAVANLKLSNDELTREKLFVNKGENEKMKALAAVYESMTPKEAADKFNALDVDTTAKLVSQMEKRKAGKILGAMEIPRAVEITKRMQAITQSDKSLPLK